jgi:molecular chaperone GrpE
MGVEAVGAADEPFDPTRHLALFYEERPGLSDSRVANVIRPGYRLGTRMLRPAQVWVVGPAAEDESTGAASASDGEAQAAHAEHTGATRTGGDDGASNRH